MVFAKLNSLNESSHIPLHLPIVLLDNRHLGRTQVGDSFYPLEATHRVDTLRRENVGWGGPSPTKMEVINSGSTAEQPVAISGCTLYPMLSSWIRRARNLLLLFLRMRTSCSGVGAFLWDFTKALFFHICVHLYIFQLWRGAFLRDFTKALVLYTRACLLASAYWEYADGFLALLHVFDNVFMMFDIMLWLWPLRT